MSKIIIGTPFKESAPDRYITSLVNMVLYTQAAGHEVAFESSYGGLWNARDRICRSAIRGKYDYMLQIDSDMTFPPEALCAMLDRNVDICTGVYVGQETEHKPVLFTSLHKDSADMGAHAKKAGLRELLKEDLFEVAGTGAGFLLVREHVLRLMMIHLHEWFRPYEGLGEDVSFCERARELGFKIWADNSFPMGHVKYTEYVLEDWNGIEDEDFNKKLSDQDK